MLVAIPIGWLWLLSQLGQSYLAVYALALGGCPIMMVSWGLVLLRLNRVYARLQDGGETGALLELSIALSVVVAVVILAIWLFLFSQGGGPVQGPWPG